MSQGGGFCEIHGPYDPPHLVCPYCAMQDEQRKLYGPPGGTPLRPPAERPPDSATETDFVRQTVEPEVVPNLTELVSRPPSDLDEAENALPPILGWLIVKEPAERRGEIIPIRANQIIGREGDIRWEDPKLSRHHARLTLEPPGDMPEEGPLFHVWPFGPTNPVVINGREIRGATPLRENDEIRLGDTLLVLKLLAD
jgi:hypothetical protein